MAGRPHDPGTGLIAAIVISGVFAVVSSPRHGFFPLSADGQLGPSHRRSFLKRAG